MYFVDSHCHLDFAELKEGLDHHLAQAHDVGIRHFIVPGVSSVQSASLIEFAKKYPQCHIAIGLHPYFIEQHNEQAFADIKALAQQYRDDIVAIGECGIDGTCPNLDYQLELFVEHIRLSNQLTLPLIVHHRQSHHLIAQAFKLVPPKHGGVIHAFSGSMQQAQYYIKQGFKLGVGGTISYERANKTRQVFAQLPLESVLLETDAPSMPLSGYQGQVNVPKRLVEVFRHLCQLRSESPEHIAQQLYSSSCTLFRI
ncbi:putative metal-dependent hydrolase YjjV [Pseudoalteromonas holothuriae]|uniref:Metal-dependent hydrolase YjjV n=1 Tax=Pseudoalteromonas holothuriae TaxID=2963714 RepID=A0A9W4R1G3_9GAMM|nr:MULTISPECIES: TatD family hydrolase [unclassified Pseudoalteromonas]CAH9056455.1 putative metal-dependent hydrolase YjjV [Pseudoalteromonas sp. CIP111951]CAH9062912.1 putative metal-dependent hydrolase YjjV [Pseudoalteromonas sp. CIP111854]